MENSLNFLSDKLVDILPLIGLYAETHFRFRIPFSRYFKKEPELIFDAPWRIDPGQKLSIFLIVKDAHLYPVQIERVEIEVFQEKRININQKWQINELIQDQQKDYLFTFEADDVSFGDLEIVPRLFYSIAGKSLQMEMNNYEISSKPALRVTMAKEKLPKLEGWQSGDTHLHTSLTNDQIEFGASLQQTRQAGQLLGLDFITATDHSYDLDDQADNYLVNDPDLGKWKESRALISDLNRENSLPIIPGEEISVANHRGATVHFLHFNDPIYFPGCGDSGEDWPKIKSQLTIEDVLDQRSAGSISVAAHSAYKFPWLQRVLLNRGFWESQDHDNPDLNGVQILCGTPASSAYHLSRQLWIEALLRGRKLGVYGGSDGHGNFNRNWHVRLPTWSLGSHEDQLFGQSRTILRTKGSDISVLVEAMKHRRTALSTGPMGDLVIKSKGLTYGVGDILQAAPGDSMSFLARGVSSKEFGSVMDVSIYSGNLDDQSENLQYHGSDLEHEFEIEQELVVSGKSYLRLEISSEGSRWPGLFVSSPIWIEV